MPGRSDVPSHKFDIFVCRLRLCALRANMSCLCFTYRFRGVIPILVSIASVGVFVSSPKAFRIIEWRAFFALSMCPLFVHTSIP